MKRRVLYSEMWLHWGHRDCVISFTKSLPDVTFNAETMSGRFYQGSI